MKKTIMILIATAYYGVIYCSQDQAISNVKPVAFVTICNQYNPENKDITSITARIISQPLLRKNEIWKNNTIQNSLTFYHLTPMLETKVGKKRQRFVANTLFTTENFWIQVPKEVIKEETQDLFKEVINKAWDQASGRKYEKTLTCWCYNSDNTCTLISHRKAEEEKKETHKHPKKKVKSFWDRLNEAESRLARSEDSDDHVPLSQLVTHPIR